MPQMASGSKHLTDPTDAVHQYVHLLKGIVEGERSAYRSKNAQAVHQGLGTVVAGAYGDAEAVEQGADVEVVDLTNIETYDGIL